MTTAHAPTQATTTPATTTPAAAEEAIALLTATVRNTLMRRHAFSEQLATEWAATIIAALREEHGGEDIYLKAPDRSERDAAIRRDIRPGNAAQLARQWGITVSQVYRIAGTR